jgi:acetyl esterase/lipase
MKKLIKVLTYLSALLSLLPFLKPQAHSQKFLLWIPKIFGGALAPIHTIICGVGALVGLSRRDWKLASAGLIGAGLAAKFIEAVPLSQDQFAETFGGDWEARIPAEMKAKMLPERFSLPAAPAGEVQFEQNIVFAQNPETGEDLLADLWQPQPETFRSGLGIVYVHGGGWVINDKDVMTRPFFQRLAAQGHVILDIAYTLWPQASMSVMVTEVNQAILWLKEHCEDLEINPERIVAMGGSAGAHLALMAAYTSDLPDFKPYPEADTRVCGAAVHYPPVDLAELASQEYPIETWVDRLAEGMERSLFKRPATVQGEEVLSNLLVEILGGTPEEIPETYRLLSPISHVTPACPPTLILQGSDDVFDLVPGVHRINQALETAGVSHILVEFPHTEHGFDLIFPQISPVAQAATYDVERFLAMLI